MARVTRPTVVWSPMAVSSRRVRGEVVEFRRKLMAARPDCVRRHLSHNVFIECIDGDTAIARSYTQSYDIVGRKELTLTHSGTSEDRLTKLEGRWMFSERILSFDWISEDWRPSA